MSSEERNWGMACHLSALVGFFIPMGWILGPLICWLIKREQYPFVDEQGKEALNFQISIFIYEIIAGILCIVLIGIPILIALGVFMIAMVIIAATKTSRGEHHRYPFTIRFIK